MRALILMGTYNGERFLESQLASIRAQTDRDWRLLVRDDASTDATRTLLAQAARADPRLELMPEDGTRHGAAGNFVQLMHAAVARDEPVIAFCDQDDIWLPQKLARQKRRLAEAEHIHGRSCPILVHSDLEVVDERLHRIHPSFMRFQLINRPGDLSPLTLLAQNHVAGCTMLMNRALLELATPVPTVIYMHDWWVTLCASFAGVRCYVPEPLARYRQHPENQVGAQGVAGRLSRPGTWVAWITKMNRIYRAAFAQAEALGAHLVEPEGPVCDPDAGDARKRALHRYLALRQTPRLLRPWYLMRMGVRSQNPMMTSMFYLQSVTLKLEPRPSALMRSTLPTPGR